MIWEKFYVEIQEGSDEPRCPFLYHFFVPLTVYSKCLDVSFKRAVNSMVRGSRGSVPAPRSRRLAICPSIFGGGGDGGCGGQRATLAEPREPCSPTTDGSCM